jgi:hypothetical protein
MEGLRVRRMDERYPDQNPEINEERKCECTSYPLLVINIPEDTGRRGNFTIWSILTSCLFPSDEITQWSRKES